MSWNPTNYQFAWNVVYEYRFWLLEGTLLTLKIAALSMALAMVFALLLALLRMSRVWVLSGIAMVYIAVLRAIPLLVFILCPYFVVSLVTGLQVDAFGAAVICLPLKY